MMMMMVRVVMMVMPLPAGVESIINTCLEDREAVHLHKHPQLEGIYFTPALDTLVPSVEAHVIELVLLEEVGGACRVALL